MAEQMMNNEGDLPDNSGEGGSQQGGYVIEIRVSAGGDISVSSEPLAEEDGEGTGTPAKSIGEAMKLAMDIYENNGQAADGEEAFNAGYGPGQQPRSLIREGE